MKGWPVGMRFSLSVAAMLVCWCILSAPAWADGEFVCVRCTGPDQTYRCHAMSDDSVPGEALRYFCMAQIAQDHVHESCAAVRKAEACEGRDVSYVYQDGVGDRASPTGSSAPPQKQEPATLADMSRATMEATVKAGRAVGDATKRTLKCLGAALNDC